MGKHNTTGRSKSHGRYVQAYEYVMRSTGWMALSPMGRCAWLEINLIFFGNNNGRLAVSSRQLSESLGCGKTAAANAIRELINCGFLDLVTPSDFGRKKRAAEYRLTHLPCDATKAPASKRFLNHGKIGRNASQDSSQ